MSQRNDKYEAPLTFDMDFGEALERLANTAPNEVKWSMEGKKPKRKKQLPELVWTKKLSKTDAQQETTGGLVPYLRLTKSSLDNEDFQVWFREDFFTDADWQDGEFGRETEIEVAHVEMMVSINGVKLGNKQFMVTHGPNRCEKHNTPNTWLHWPDAIESILQENDLTDCPVFLKRGESGEFSLEIQAASS